MTDDALVLRRHIAAPLERVFSGWTDPQLLARWMSPVGHAEVKVDLRVGGALRVVMVGGGRRIEHSGEYLEIEPPHRLVFTWLSPYTGQRPSRVTVELESAGSGTDVTLRHELLPARTAESHRGGWRSMVERLAELMTSEVVPDGA